MSGKVTNIEERRKKRKSSKKQKKIIRILVISVIIGYFIIRAVPMVLSSHISTKPVEKEVFTDKIDSKGILFKKETVYTRSAENLEFAKKEGERIGSGETIAVSKSKDYASLEQELQTANESIQLYTELLNEYSWLRSLKEKEEDAVESYVNHLREKTKLEDERLESIRRDIQNGTKSNESFFKEEIEKLESTRSQTEEKLKTGKETYFAKSPGVVSSKLDGFEEELNFEALEKLDSAKYNEIKGRIKSAEKKDISKGVKTVEGHIWYMALDIDKAYGNEFKDKTSVEVEFNKGEYALKGKIKQLDIKDRALMVIEFNEGLHRFYDDRYVDVAIVKGRYSGLRVPSSAITEQDGQRGVYIKEVSGIVKFIPVRLLYKGDEYSIVNDEEQGSIEYKKKGETVTARSLQVFDEVFENSMFVRENQVVN
ncbi:HlyD family secretion protein [Andreesenia angusta]|uniref:HlyD family secretion protein n=1 Tax=Andreesenia angusta TaxID=39480 RepID=A0A1S1V7P5_9FIRM|nr:HlyD family efflux transporter periplasmic adaptor subunit [Andreesenia angusta]OHW62621.1 HlyD family secretion protein [Andreesenia angusta]